jgi:hypothetical protein
MNRLRKLPRETQVQLGVGAVLMILSVIWLSVVFYVMTPDRIQPTGEDVRTAYGAFLDAADVPASQWTLSIVSDLFLKGAILIIVDLAFVIARYGGLTLLFLGAFAIFEALSNTRKARR